MLCGSDKRGNGCNGDGGGPLICKVVGKGKLSYMDQHTLFGLTTFGKAKCSIKKGSTVFVNIQFYLDWIKSQIDLN